jgi:putative ABC transport system ATP-binding protein
VVVATHDERITQLADRVIELVPHLRPEQRQPREVTLHSSEVLFQQGDPSDLVYVVQSGQMEILRETATGEQELLRLVDPGSYFGELGPMLNLPRSATARATQPTVLTGCTVQQFRATHPRQRLDASLSDADM